jgi:hypothetical protein
MGYNVCPQTAGSSFHLNFFTGTSRISVPTSSTWAEGLQRVLGIDSDA